MFTTGGIGPTHDDITADAVAAAFGLAVEPHPEAMALLASRYKPGEFNEARQRMARVPQGASLIEIQFRWRLDSDRQCLRTGGRPQDHAGDA